MTGPPVLARRLAGGTAGTARGLRLPSAAAFGQVLAAARETGPVLVADLALGGWRGHEAARQLCAQLSLDPLLPSAPPPGLGPTGGPVRYADLIGAGIEQEAAGDRETLLTARLSARVADALARAAAEGPSTVLVLLPLADVGWESEDIAFVKLLAARPATDPRARHRLLLVDTGDGRCPPPGLRVRWDAVPGPREAGTPADCGDLALVPGLPDAELAARCGAGPAGPAVVDELDGLDGLDGLVALPGGRLLVPPAVRRPPFAADPRARLRFDALAARAGDVGWLRAYAQVHGNNAFVDPEFLCREAWRVFAAGGGGAAVRLAARAAECGADPVRRAVARAHLEGMHIALCRYSDAAAAPDPSPALPPVLRGFLLQAKGWGLALSPDPARAVLAEPYLAAARDLLAGSADEREYLYLLNISALCRLKAGRAGDALAWEREIERRAALLRPPDHRLSYVNALNLARLYRRSGDREAARHHYRRAFATVDGVRSASDAVHREVCLAQVAADREEEYRRRLRAALYWLSAEVPEALAWRVVVAVLGRRPERDEAMAGTADTVDAVSAALAERLAAAAGVVEDGVVEDGPGPAGPVPLFGSLETLRDFRPRWAASGAGWSVYGGPETLRPAGAPDPDGHRPARLALRGLVHRLLLAECPATDLADARLLAVELGDGRGMRHGSAAAYGCALRGVPVLHTPSGPVFLDEVTRAGMRERMRVRLGPAVERVERKGPGARVHFRRYRPVLRLSAEQTALVERALAGAPLGELTGHQENRYLLDALVDARVLALDPPVPAPAGSAR